MEVLSSNMSEEIAKIHPRHFRRRESNQISVIEEILSNKSFEMYNILTNSKLGAHVQTNILIAGVRKARTKLELCLQKIGRKS